MEILTQAQTEFNELMHDVEKARELAYKKELWDLGHKISGLIQALKAFTPAEIDQVEELFD